MFYWWRAYHVRLTKLDCLPRISARGKQCIIHRVNNKKYHVRHHGNTRSLDSSVNDIVYSIKFNVFQKINKIFHVFSYEVRFVFSFFDYWYIIKYLLTETPGKQYVLWTLNCRCFLRLRLGNMDSLGSTKHTVSLGLSQ